MDARRKKKVGVALAIWLLLSVVMLLAPAPQEWGEFGRRVESYYRHVQSFIQPATHVVLMAICAFLLVASLCHRSPGTAFLVAAISTMLFALALELLQGALPVRFSRACDPGDLLPSVAGTLVGGGMGLRRRLKNENRRK